MVDTLDIVILFWHLGTIASSLTLIGITDFTGIRMTPLKIILWVFGSWISFGIWMGKTLQKKNHN